MSHKLISPFLLGRLQRAFSMKYLKNMRSSIIEVV